MEGLNYFFHEAIGDLVLLEVRPKDLLVLWLARIFNYRLPLEDSHFLWWIDHRLSRFGTLWTSTWSTSRWTTPRWATSRWTSSRWASSRWCRWATCWWAWWNTCWWTWYNRRSCGAATRSRFFSCLPCRGASSQFLNLLLIPF